MLYVYFSFLFNGFWLSLILSTAVIILTCIYVYRWKTKQPILRSDSFSPDSFGSHYRFRKRDKVMFYSKKVLRKVKSLGSNGSTTAGKPKMKKRERLLKIASRMLRMDKEAAVRPTKRPPAAFFEPDTSASEPDLPPEILYMLKNIRAFGHFEAPLILELCRHINVVHLPAGSVLFQPGDKDDTMYVVKSGRLTVYIREQEQEFPVKTVGQGDSVFSLLSILDVLTGHAAPFKTVSAKTDEDSVILKLYAQAFSEIFERYPESWLRVVQIVVLTLQRVMFTTLHTYFGLSTELQKQTLREMPSKKSLPAGPEQMLSKSSKPRVPLCGRSQSIGNAEAFLTKLHHRQSESFDADYPENIAPPFGLYVRSTSRDDKRESSFKVAVTSLNQLLGLEDEDNLETKVRLQAYPPGYVLCEQGSLDVSLLYVLSGSLDLSQRSMEDEDVLISVAQSHEMVGGLAVLTGEPSFYTIKTRQFTRLAMIKKEDFYELMSRKPRIVLNVAHTVIQRLSPFVRSISFALDLEISDAGRALYNQHDNPEALYLVLSGRLRSVLTKDDGSKELVEEYGRGDLVGMVELLTRRPRSTTVISIRHTELAKVPEGLLNLIKLKYPQVLTRMIQLLGNCILGQHEQKLTPGRLLEPMPHVSNLNTIAVMGVSPDVPLLGFTLELYHALNALKPTLRLSSDTILKSLGVTVMEGVNEYRLLSWLSQQEDAYPIVLYQCDFELTNWTRRCIRQADCILIVANGENEPTVGPVEQLLETLTVRAQKELILLWGEDVDRPQRTADWLDVRGWVSSHYHLKVPHRMYIKKSPTKMLELYERIFAQPADKFSDFSRLARTLTGKSIGLVLGGGGARGAAHVGILKSLKDAGVPVDIVAGVSIGSFIGGLYCMDPDISRLIPKSRAWFMEMSSLWNQLFDLTYPSSAIFTGASFNNSLKKYFKDCQIEDLWIPYFNVTTDITSSEMRIHRHGDLWRYVRASMSYCGVLPPMCNQQDGHYLVDGCYVNNLPGSLWRFCRASMSLAGYMPPVCDPSDGHLLLDGGYVNNLPADVMRSMGVATILAVDVGAQDETDLTNYGDSLSGWWLLWKRWVPFTKPIKVLNMAEIQSRLAYVSCVRQLELVKKAPYCVYVRPPIDKYQTLEFAKYDEIFNLGLDHGKKLFDVWSKNGKLEEILHGNNQSTLSNQDLAKSHSKEVLLRNQSSQTFTDLAALVSKIHRPLSMAISDAYLSDVSEETDDETDEEEDLPNVDDAASCPPAKKRVLETLASGDSVQMEDPDDSEPGPDRDEENEDTISLPISSVSTENEEDVSEVYARRRKVVVKDSSRTPPPTVKDSSQTPPSPP